MARPTAPVRSRTRARALLVAVVATLATLAPAASGAADTATLEGGSGLALEPVVADGGLDSPMALAVRAGQDELFVAERAGRVRVVDGETGAVAGTPLLDISSRVGESGEGGLLGLAFDPAGAKLYLNFTNNSGDLRLFEYGITGTSTTSVVPGSRRLVLSIRHQPNRNHNGGDITFGPDGKLYIAVGDGGGANDPDGNGLNRQVLLGKVLRINPAASATRPYRVPPGNPFVGQSPRRPEIWLYGVRNPWRISFDAETGDLVVADVGQDTWEEVDVLANTGPNPRGRGANLGWSRMEGPETFGDNQHVPANHTAPTFAYQHGTAVPSGIQGCSIIGGYVYRGADVPALAGRYVFGDFCTGVLSAMSLDGATVTADLGVSADAFSLTSFGQGPDGELYVLSSDGSVSRLAPAT